MGHIFLVVDDDENGLQVTLQALELHYPDGEFHAARTGAEGLDVLQRISPDAILLDLSLPGLDGWQVLKAVRALPGFQSVPVIAMTAYDSANVNYDALQAGFDAYVPKPLDLSLLNETLVQLVD